MIYSDRLTHYISSYDVIRVEEYEGEQYVGVPLTTPVALPDGSIVATQAYSLNSGCLVGTTNKLAPIFNGELEPVPFEYNPDDGYFKYLPGEWIALKIYESHGWNKIRRVIEQLLDPKVKSDDVRAALNQLRPDLKIKAKWKGSRLHITNGEKEITLYELIQILCQGEITLL